MAATKVYLDNNDTTPLSPEAADQLMHEYELEFFPTGFEGVLEPLVLR